MIIRTKLIALCSAAALAGACTLYAFTPAQGASSDVLSIKTAHYEDALQLAAEEIEQGRCVTIERAGASTWLHSCGER